MIFIPGNVVSSKNSKRIFYNKKFKHPFVYDSIQTVNYKKATRWYWERHREDFHKLIQGMSKPFIVQFTFVREAKHRFDYVNLMQLPLDCMVKYGWIEDDDYTNVIPSIVPAYINRKNPGVFINVIGV